MKLMYLNGEMTGREVELLPSGVTIGRESDNVVQLLMDGVSRYHAKIDCDASGNWMIRDLGSTNGTFIDDVSVHDPVPLRNGAVLTIGTQLLRCVDGSGSATSGSVPVSPAQPQAQPQPSSQPQQDASQQIPPQPAFFFRPKSCDPTRQLSVEPEPPKAAPKAKSKSGEHGKSFFGKDSAKKEPSDRMKKLIGNVIFTLIVIIAAFVGIIVFLLLNHGSRQESGGQTPTREKVSNPFVLYYEKESVTGTSVFRFTLQVENGLMEVTLDEPLNKRRYYELFKEPLPENLVNKLKQQILDSGFLDLQQEKIAGTSQDNSQHRRIMVGFDNKFCDVKVANDVSETFNHAESIIYETLLDEYDLGVISQNVDQILEDAKRFLFVADEAYRSIDTTPSNLPKAITNYRLALRRYALFEDPKPAAWLTAKNGLAEAEAKLESIRTEGNKTVKLYYELKEYEKAIAECNRLLDIFPPDSKTHKSIRETKLRIERKLSMGNK